MSKFLIVADDGYGRVMCSNTVDTIEEAKDIFKEYVTTTYADRYKEEEYNFLEKDVTIYEISNFYKPKITVEI